jgi:hypothetical protein
MFACLVGSPCKSVILDCWLNKQAIAALHRGAERTAVWLRPVSNENRKQTGYG